MIVLIEGADGSGKSTLCNQLRFEGYTPISIPQDASQRGSYWICAYDTHVYVSDRSYISDMVYRIFDGKHRQGMSLQDMLFGLEKYTKIILCESGTEYDDSMARGEDNITKKKDSDKIKQIYNIITSMFKIFADVPVMKYNWRTDNLDDVIKFIEGGTTNESV